MQKNMNYKKISILILTYNNKNLLKNLLASIKEKTHYPNYEIIVIDNGGSDGTDEMIKNQYKGIKLVKIIDNKGFIGGFNEGFKKSKLKSDFFVFLCDDTYIITDNWLTNLVNAFEEFKDLGAIFPIEIIPPEFGSPLNKIKKFDLIKDFLKNRVHIYEDWANDRPKEKIEFGHVLEGPCLMIKNEVLKSTGLFELLFFPAYCEDTDLGLKILRAGYNTARNPNVGIIHFHSISINSLMQTHEKRLLLARNRIIQGILNRNVKDLIRQFWFEFQTFFYDMFKLKIKFSLIFNAYIYILKNFKKIYQARLFRKELLKNAKNKNYFLEFSRRNLCKVIFQPPMFNPSKKILCKNEYTEK
ncbi:MAG: glycosyltransferase family 2 protein [Candidatus Helarchaeota archaeon]